ncbi:MAG: hypothetical protein GC154_05720 [bacterium]|nr:hypothetical protein [bacterium]
MSDESDWSKTVKKNCPFNDELLVSYASGNCDAQERAQVERHVASCGECRREIVELEKAWWSLDTWNDENIPVQPRFNELLCRIQTKAQPISLRERMIPYWRQARQAMTHAPKFAAAATIGCMLLLAASQSVMDPAGASSPVVQPQYVSNTDSAQLIASSTESLNPLLPSVKSGDQYKEAARELLRLQDMVALNESGMTRVRAGWTPRSVVPANNDMVAVSVRPSVAHDAAVYLGE